MHTLTHKTLNTLKKPSAAAYPAKAMLALSTLNMVAAILLLYWRVTAWAWLGENMVL